MMFGKHDAVFSKDEQLTDKDFCRLSQFVRDRSGINLPSSKKVLMEGRLRRRLWQLNLTSYADYCHFIFECGNAEEEEAIILDAITTHKTDFFRELHHFRFLADVILPDLMNRAAGRRAPFRFWSSACSNGAEPYSIAMVCQEFAERYPGFQFEVLGSDISSSMLEASQRAIYPHAMAEAIPMAWRKKYLLRAKAGEGNEVRVVPELRRLVRFGHVNLIWDEYPIDGFLDVIFCRNVLIYFVRQTQQAVLGRLCRYLGEGGYLILGHSENISGLSLPLRGVAPTVFVREPSP